MGLDIYFRKVKNYDGRNDWSEVHEFMEDQNREEVKKVYDGVIKSLSRAKDYDKSYARVIKRLANMFSFPQYNLRPLGVEYDYQTDKYSYTPVDLSTLKEEEDKIVADAYKKEDAYFRKVNFIYAYFKNKLVEEEAWVEKSDLEDLISRCEKVLANHTLADELLPTQSGFFFGSTDYDEWYYHDVRDCLKQMKKLLKGLKDDEQLFVRMSW